MTASQALAAANELDKQIAEISSGDRPLAQLSMNRLAEVLSFVRVAAEATPSTITQAMVDAGAHALNESAADTISGNQMRLALAAALRVRPVVLPDLFAQVARVTSIQPLEHTATIKWTPAQNGVLPAGFDVGRSLYVERR